MSVHVCGGRRGGIGGCGDRRGGIGGCGGRRGGIDRCGERVKKLRMNQAICKVWNIDTL